ncbi:MAG: hypothetical protein DRR08_31865 [Candidatus Parabeggiatoa sp. nov. 2]|nr:MAG: hypothetical protein DRR08_31865 [Gammaproteobacteria bacterium]
MNFSALRITNRTAKVYKLKVFLGPCCQIISKRNPIFQKIGFLKNLMKLVETMRFRPQKILPSKNG